MTDLKTTQEISRTPDGSEFVRLATTGANWKATLTDIFTALGGGGTGSLTVGTTTISGGTTKHVVYDNAGVVGEAANFTIESGNPNVTDGHAYLYGGTQVIQAQISLGNFFEGGSGNLTATGAANLGTGKDCLINLTTGANNMGVGNNALQQCLDGFNNVAIGTDSLIALTSGFRNMAIGSGAMAAAIDASDNVGIGVGAAGAMINSTSNIAIGVAALGTQQHNFYNVGIGPRALVFSNGGNANTGIGAYSGFGAASATGSENTFLGYLTGATVASGSNNIVIGSQCDVSSSTANGQLCIGNYIYGTGLTGTGSTISTAKIGLGIKAPANELDLAGAFSLTTFIEGTEMSAPAAPATNGFRIFAQDNGAGKTQLMVIFNSGAAQQIAIQP